MIRRNFNSVSSSKQVQSHSVHKIQPKIQQIRHNRRYSIAGNSIVYHNDKTDIDKSMQKSPLSNNIVHSTRKSGNQYHTQTGTQNYESLNRRDNYESNRKVNNYSYSTKPNIEPKQTKQFDSNNFTTLKRQTASTSACGQLRSRNRNYLGNNNQKQSLLLNANYSKYSDGLALRRQYKYQQNKQVNQTKPFISVSNCQKQTNEPYNKAMNNGRSIQSRIINTKKSNEREYPTNNMSFQTTPNNIKNYKIGESDRKLKFDYQKFEKKYNYSKDQKYSHQKQCFTGENQFFSHIELISDKNIKPLFEDDNQKNQRSFKSRNQSLKQNNFQFKNKQRQKINIRQEKEKGSQDRKPLKICQFMEKQSYQIQKNAYQIQNYKNSQPRTKNQGNYASQNIYKVNYNQQIQQEKFDDLKKKLQDVIMQKQPKRGPLNNNFLNEQIINTRMKGKELLSLSSITPVQNTQKININEILSKEVKGASTCFSNYNQYRNTKEINNDKENNLPKDPKNNFKFQNLNNFSQNSRISLPEKDKCLNLLDLNVPSFGRTNKNAHENDQKLRKDSQNRKQIVKIQSQKDGEIAHSKFSDNSQNKMSTLSKLKMIGEFNDKINQRIKHIIQNFQGYQMKI